MQPDQDSHSLDWGPTSKDIDEFRALVTSRTLRRARPGNLAEFDPESSMDEINDWEVDDDDGELGHEDEQSNGDDGDVFELAEQIEVDNSRALMIGTFGPADDAAYSSPSKSLLSENIVYSPLH